MREYKRLHSKKRRLNPVYREAQKQRYKAWYRLHREDAELLKRKREQAKRYRSDPVLRMRHEARWQANRARAAGRLKPESCRDCGETKVQMHHPDYYKPLEVVWLCRACHLAEHAKAKGQP